MIVLTNKRGGNTLRARLVRGGRIYAKAVRLGSGHLTLRSRHRVSTGRYRLVLTQSGHLVARVPIRKVVRTAVRRRST
jgi:hypothetical protein